MTGGVTRLSETRSIPIPDSGLEHTWRPIDLAAAEALPPEPPTISGIVYPGRVHVWSGEPETLKSLVAMAVGLAEIRQGHDIVYIDLENGVRETTARLRALGATSDELARFVYITPAQRLEADLLADTLTLLSVREPTVVFVDSYTGSLALDRCDPNSALDVERHHQEVVNPLRSTGAGVVLLDHLVKNRENRGRYSIGSERKIGVCDVHLGFELVLPLSRGGRGVVKLATHKDRPGYLHRPKAAQATFNATAAGELTWELEQTEDDPAAAVADFRPTILMERVSTYLQIQRESVPLNRIEENVQGNGKYLRKAVDALVREGYCAEQKGPRGSRLITFIRNYSENTESIDLVPTSSSTPNYDLVPTSSSEISLNGAENPTSSHLVPTSSSSSESTSSPEPPPPQGGRSGQDEVSNPSLIRFLDPDPDAGFSPDMSLEPDPDDLDPGQ